MGDADVEFASVQFRADLIGGQLLHPHLHRRVARQELGHALRCLLETNLARLRTQLKDSRDHLFSTAAIAQDVFR